MPVSVKRLQTFKLQKKTPREIGDLSCPESFEKEVCTIIVTSDSRCHYSVVVACVRMKRGPQDHGACREVLRHRAGETLWLQPQAIVLGIRQHENYKRPPGSLFFRNSLATEVDMIVALDAAIATQLSQLIRWIKKDCQSMVCVGEEQKKGANPAAK